MPSSSTPYFADRAVRGNATCRHCREKIKQHELRLGWYTDSREFGEYKSYYHVECFRPRTEGVSINDFELLPSLEPGDGDIVKMAIKGDLRRHNLEQLAGEEEEDEEEDVAETEKRRKLVKRGKTATRRSSSSSSSATPNDDRRRSPRLAKISSSSSDATSANSPETTTKRDKNNNNNRRPSSPDSPRKRARNGGSPAPQEYFIAAPPKSPHPLIKLTSDHPVIAKYEEMTAYQLKDILRRNGQILKGRKEDLVAKCADGEINGRIPGCPLCRQGQIFFVPERGVYECRGHYDADNFVFIRCAFNEPQIVREKWRRAGEEPLPKNYISPKSFKGVFAKYGKPTTSSSSAPEHISIPTMTPPTVPPTGTAHPENEVIAQLFEDLAAYTRKLKPEHYVWKVRAFNHVARQIRTIPYEIKDGKSLAEGKTKVEGIGKESARIIDDFLKQHKTTSTELEKLKSEYFKQNGGGGSEEEEEEDYEDYE